jgi:hypothetical protein
MDHLLVQSLVPIAGANVGQFSEPTRPAKKTRPRAAAFKCLIDKSSTQQNLSLNPLRQQIPKR